MASERLDRRRFWKALALGAAAALVVLLAAPLIGPAKVDFARALARQSPDYELMVELRLPRVLLAMLAGGVLSLAGALFQGLLRDALATPFTVGVSSGASLGAVAAICFGWRQAGHMPAIWVGAFCGAALVLARGAGHRRAGTPHVHLHPPARRRGHQQHLRRAHPARPQRGRLLPIVLHHPLADGRHRFRGVRHPGLAGGAHRSRPASS